MDIDECVELANYADECGLDGVMIISPWYFRLTDEGIYTFYSQIARRTAAKIFIYNFPERTGYSVSPEVCLRLAREFPNIIGLKDTIPDTNHTSQVIRQVKSELPYFEVYAGYDNNFAHNVLSGGNGCIGGLSNICPELFRDWMQAFSDNDLPQIRRYQQKVDGLMDIYAVNDPFIPTFKKHYSCAELFSPTAARHRLARSPPARPKVFSGYFPVRVLKLMPDPYVEVL